MLISTNYTIHKLKQVLSEQRQMLVYNHILHVVSGDTHREHIHVDSVEPFFIENRAVVISLF